MSQIFKFKSIDDDSGEEIIHSGKINTLEQASEFFKFFLAANGFLPINQEIIIMNTPVESDPLNLESADGK